MSRVQSFSLETGDAPRRLILGSMPGVASLQAVQYYAHPRNAFWPIVADYFGFDAEAPYQERLSSLVANGVALWDVLQSCVRPGSLDSAIERDSVIPNRIDQWLAEQPTVELILLNGGKAASEFRRHFKPLLNRDDLKVLSLPSTSPANARMTFEAKRVAWHDGLGGV